jgi:hypothetical protein
VRCGRFYAVVETRPSVGGARRFVAWWGYFRRRRLRARLFEGSTVASKLVLRAAGGLMLQRGTLASWPKLLRTARGSLTRRIVTLPQHTE